MIEGICHCNDICGLMRFLDYEYKASKWRLFIDSNKTSLKALLLHNENKTSSVPIAYTTQTKKSYETMKRLLACIKYDVYQ